MIYGCVSNCWRLQFAEGATLAAILERALREGWQYVELRQGCLGDCERGHPLSPDAQALGKLAARFPELQMSLALAWPAFGAPSPADRELFDRGLEASAAAAGARPPLLRLVDLATTPLEAEARVASHLVDDWLQLADRAAASGVALAIENAGQPWGVLREALRRTRAALGSRRGQWRLCFDAVNLLKAADKPDPVAALQSLQADELAMVHFKQSRGGAALPVVAKGDVVWRRQLAALKQIGYDGIGLFEIDGHADVWRHLHESLIFLNRQRKKPTRQALAKLALTDPLTQLPNRRAWRRELSRRWKRAARDGSPLCLAILDLDRFKSVNDSQGHLAGDACLKAAAAALRRHTRTGDFLARVGGDEFGLLLSGLSAEDAARVVERVRAGVSSASNKEAANMEAPLSASAGFAVWHGRPEIDTVQLFAAADAALLEAKRAGGGVVIAATC